MILKSPHTLGRAPNRFIGTILSVLIVAIAFVFSESSHAQTTKTEEKIKFLGVDVYGTDDKESAKILKKYKTQLKQFKDAVMPVSNSNWEMKDFDTAKKIRNEIKAGIMAEGRFSYVDLSTIVYKDENQIATTIDLVENKDQLTRNTFGPEPKLDTKDPNGLIKAWREYEAIGWKLLYTNKIKGEFSDCPYNHCTYGYDDPKLAPFKNKFKSVSKYEKEIIYVLRNDKDHEKRAAAALLIGLLQNPDSIAHALMPSLHDPDMGVRNNAMRVIGTTKMKHSDLNIDIHDFINALNGPTTIDRNKSLFLVFQLTEDPRTAVLLNNKETKNILVNILKLKQPNNHDIAYLIVKKLSRKNYPDTDVKSWTAWANESDE